MTKTQAPDSAYHTVEAAFRVADSARLVGRFRLGSGVHIAQGSVMRSIDDSVTIGDSTWLLENSVLIGMPEFPVKIGGKTVFGHKCLVLGAAIGNFCEIGNGTIFLPGSKVGNFCIFGEGTLVTADQVIPDESVAVGRPARVIRKLTTEDRAMIARMRGQNLSLAPSEEHVVNFDPKGGADMGKLYPYGDKHPVIGATAFIYDTAEINGDVIIGEGSVIGAGVRIIGDSHGPVRIGNNVQILENTVLHLLPDNQLIIEDDVVIGPGCIIHGTTIGSGSVIEPGAIVCDYSTLGRNTLVTTGSLVKQRSIFADNDIVEGFPAKKVGQSTARLAQPPWTFREWNKTQNETQIEDN
ncbi:MAG: DapH/DapD/GlmU-related protein [Saccharofermentanales bacterium]